MKKSYGRKLFIIFLCWIVTTVSMSTAAVTYYVSIMNGGSIILFVLCIGSGTLSYMAMHTLWEIIKK